jgi:hypothetical protein
MKDLARLRVTPDLRLLKDRLAIAHDLEPTAARRHHLDLRGRELLANRGRQTDGPWLVVSDRAVFDRDPHRHAGEGHRANASAAASRAKLVESG